MSETVSETVKEVYSVREHPNASPDKIDGRIYARDLLQNVTYQRLLTVVERLKPHVPIYDPKGNNIEEMKFMSAKLQHHEAIMKLLKGDKDGTSTTI